MCFLLTRRAAVPTLSGGPGWPGSVKLPESRRGPLAASGLARRVVFMVRVAPGLALIAVLVLFASCGDEDATGGAPRAQPTPTPSPAPTATPEPARAPPVRLTVSVSGDLLPHLPIVDRARALGGGRDYDFAPLLGALRPLVRSADLAFCHVETPLVAGPPQGYPTFATPPDLARAIKSTGWDACSTASNHTLDQGQAGVASTLRALRRAGVRSAGSATSAAGARRLTILRARGVRVAFLSYTAVSNGQAVPAPWSVAFARPERILRDARQARRRGAEAVVVNVHWGTEYRSSPDPAQQRLAQQLAGSADITAVVGQHAHVVQPIRRLGRGWVVFGTGNLLSNQTGGCCAAASQDGALVELRLLVPPGGRARVAGVRYTPTWVRHPDYTVLPVGRALARGQADVAALRASYARTVRVMGRARGVRPVPRRLPR